MREAVSLELVVQVRVRIKVQHGQPLVQRPDRAQDGIGHRVVTAKQNRGPA